jgi:hypothetical protein
MDFSQEQDFPESTLITSNHVRKNSFLSENVLLCSKKIPLEQ